MQKGEGADSHILEEGATVSKRQQVEKGASRFSPPDRIQERKSHCEQERTIRSRSKQILTT
jgi:hypothetical protein